MIWNPALPFREIFLTHIATMKHFLGRLLLLYRSVKRLSFYLENFLKGRTQNNKVNNLSIELFYFELNIQYLKGMKNVLTECLSRPANKKLTDCDYKPKGKKIYLHYVSRLALPIESKDYTLQAYSTEIMSINILVDYGNTELYEISALQN